MKELETSAASPASEAAYTGDAEAAAPVPATPIVPLARPSSGLYEATSLVPQPLTPTPLPIPTPIPQPPGAATTEYEEADDFGAAVSPLFLGLRREQLRLDVDGLFPQRTASGTLYGPLAPVLHWIASLSLTASNTWSGPIWYKDGNTAAFPYTRVKIKVSRTALAPTQATITYSGGGGSTLVRTLPYKAPTFRPINLEFDRVSGVASVLDVQTHAHPNRPPNLPNETLSIATVFRRAGFDVTSNPTTVIPSSAPGANARWSDQEMHDAMQTYWSRFANAPQWAFWTLFASLHDQGTSLGGIMFDDIGPNHRQGTAIFVDAFISRAPTGDPAPAAWVRRMRFWTAVHEMGHTFNLAHSWQKSLGTPWIPLSNEAEARSFMNYPYNVSGGQSAFFANFAFRFSDQELLFMRHAPEHFVQQGNADWFDHHGFQRDKVSNEPAFTLELQTPRPTATFEFLEPIVLDLKLTNISDEPKLVDEKVLADAEGMTVIIKKKGKPARQYTPFTRRCYEPKVTALMPGQSLSDSLFVSAGINGWDIAEPGQYMIQIALHLEDDEDILSAPLMLRIERPRSYEEENLATDFFSDDVGRVLAFDGSRTLDAACDTLRETAAKLKERRVSVHAHIALGAVKARRTKVLDLKGVMSRGVQAPSTADAKIEERPADEKEAHEHLDVLTTKAKLAEQTLGKVDYAYYVEKFADILGIRSAQQKMAEIAARATSEIATPAPSHPKK